MLKWCVSLVALGTAINACVSAIPMRPFWDDIETVVVPMLRDGFNYFQTTPGRITFRPAEYYINLIADRSGIPSLTLMVSVALAALTALGVAHLVVPEKGVVDRRYRPLVAAIVFVHPVFLASLMQYDTASQALANLMSVVSILLVMRLPRALAFLCLVQIIGLLAKESFVSFFALSAALSVRAHYASFGARRAVFAIFSFAMIGIAYVTLRASAIDAAYLSHVARYQLNFGFNVVHNLALFIAGVIYFGSSADAAQGLSGGVIVSILVTAFAWSVWLGALIRRTGGPYLQRGDNPSPLILAGCLLAATFPSALAQDTSEQNATCFVAFAAAIAAWMVLPRGATERAAVGNGTLAALATIAYLSATLTAAIASTLKISQLRATSADYAQMRADAATQAGRGAIRVVCLSKPRHPFSVYYMASSRFPPFIDAELRARGLLQATDSVSCRQP
jgi:hypothetical protein